MLSNCVAAGLHRAVYDLNSRRMMGRSDAEGRFHVRFAPWPQIVTTLGAFWHDRTNQLPLRLGQESVTDVEIVLPFRLADALRKE